jgi:hypothetical protein
MQKKKLNVLSCHPLRDRVQQERAISHGVLGQLYLSYAVNGFINTCSLDKVHGSELRRSCCRHAQQRLNEMISRRDSQTSLRYSHLQLYVDRQHV